MSLQVSTPAGHLFVVRGRLEAVDCEAIVIPTDAAFAVSDTWRRAARLEDGASWASFRPDHWGTGNVADAARGTLPGGGPGATRPDVWFADVVVPHAEDLAERTRTIVMQVFKAYADWVRLPGPPFDHVEQPRGTGPVTDRGQIDNHGHVLVPAPGMAPHMLVHAHRGDAVEPGRAVDQDPVPLSEDGVVRGVPRHREGSDPGDGQVAPGRRGTALHRRPAQRGADRLEATAGGDSHGGVECSQRPPTPVLATVVEVSPSRVGHLPGCFHKDDKDWPRWGRVTRRGVCRTCATATRS